MAMKQAKTETKTYKIEEILDKETLAKFNETMEKTAKLLNGTNREYRPGIGWRLHQDNMYIDLPAEWNPLEITVSREKGKDAVLTGGVYQHHITSFGVDDQPISVKELFEKAKYIVENSGSSSDYSADVRSAAFASSLKEQEYPKRLGRLKELAAIGDELQKELNKAVKAKEKEVGGDELAVVKGGKKGGARKDKEALVG